MRAVFGCRPGPRILVDFGFAGRGTSGSKRIDPHLRGSRRSVPWSRPGQVCRQLRRWWNGLRAAGQLRTCFVWLQAVVTRKWVEAAARDVRLRGFIPVAVSMILRHQWCLRLLAGRSVVVFDERCANGDSRDALCLSILKLLGGPARAVSAIVTVPHVRRAAAFLDVEFPTADSVLHAAERRPSTARDAGCP